MAGFDAVELGEDAPPVGRVVEVGKQVRVLAIRPSSAMARPGGGGPAAALQDAEVGAGVVGRGVRAVRSENVSGRCEAIRLRPARSH